MLKRCCRTLPVVVLSSYLKKRARFYGARDVKVIPIHGIDTKKFYPRRSDMKKRLGINGKMLLTVGRLTPEKGTIHLIEAMESLIKDFPSLKLVVVGKGYLLDRLEKRVRELNLEENIYFEGFIDHFKLPDYYNAADLFVLPSLEEGLGYVSGEAMACEVPVVATDIGGIPDVIIHGKTGLLVPPRDSVALSNAIRNILNNKGLGRRLAKQGRKYILRNFEETVVTKAFNGYINNLLYK